MDISPLIGYIKIGFWRGSLASLGSRYVTYYGKNIKIFHVYTRYAYELEQKCHFKFFKYSLGNELFEKKYLDEYIKYLEENKEAIDISKFNECIDANIEIYDEILEDMPATVIKEVFSKDANTLPCVYLFSLGYVKDLRKSMTIVCKYGFTKELARRTSEHITNFTKIKGCDLKLKYDDNNI
jgi:hypothetical protein